MSTYILTTKELEKLLQNQYVERCSERSITYTPEYKKWALNQYKEGIGPREIWRKAGFDMCLLRHDYPKQCLRRWRVVVQKKGEAGLIESRGKNSSGRPKTKGLTDGDKIKRLELQVKYLEAENSFLAQLRARRAESNSGHIKNSKSLEK